MENKYADLHIHTDKSDGSHSPEKVVELAQRSGLSAIAITDHDSVEGIAQAVAKGQQLGVEIIPGIELSAMVNGEDIHILGYFIGTRNKCFLDQLSFLRQKRKERAVRIVEKLNSLGVKFPFPDLLALSASAAVGRMHVARTLLARGYIRSMPEAFWRYLGRGKPAYVPKYKLSTEKAIKIIHKQGGIAVLAHPYVIKQSGMISQLVAEGIDGVEVYHSEHPAAAARRFLKKTKQYQLLVTGGSDCHGDLKGKTIIGTVKVPYELVVRMKQKAGGNAQIN